MSAASQVSDRGAERSRWLAEREAQLRAGSARFLDRPTELIVPDAWRFGSVPFACAVLSWMFGAGVLALAFLGLALFVGAFFRNPPREIPGDAQSVVSPADGRVLDVTEVEHEGERFVRVAIFLSVFNVHVNRVPVSGRVREVSKSGDAYLAAFDPRADSRNVRCDVTLDTPYGTVRVSQITGLIARRIVCHPQTGDWLERGIRYGLIRFGSRTDVWLPADAAVQVARGQKVRGGRSVIALLNDVAIDAEEGV